MKALLLLAAGLGIAAWATRDRGGFDLPLGPLSIPVPTPPNLDGIEVARQVAGGAFLGAVGGLQRTGILPNLGWGFQPWGR